MSNIFVLDNITDFSEKINIDELYETKKIANLNKLALFQKILNRVHVRIRTTSRQKLNEQFCWFVVPEVIIGVPKYDQAECIAYIMDKLQENGFILRYFHPNTLLISWKHWVPSYVRTELKKKTGIVINEYGEKIDEDASGSGSGFGTSNKLQIKDRDQSGNINDMILNIKDSSQQQGKPSKKFTPIESYKPSGTLNFNK
jgi:hypothetical protein